MKAIVFFNNADVFSRNNPEKWETIHPHLGRHIMHSEGNIEDASNMLKAEMEKAGLEPYTLDTLSKDMRVFSLLRQARSAMGRG